MIQRELGKIKSAKFGAGGYQDAMFGFSFTLGNSSSSVGDFWGAWANHTEDFQWTIEDQNEKFIESFLKIKQLMSDAKKDDFNNLPGTPIEILFNDGKLEYWRVLKDCI